MKLKGKGVEYDGADGHLGNLQNGSVSNRGNITAQMLVSSFKSLLPKPRQSIAATSAALGVQIPHVPHHLLSLLHLLCLYTQINFY